MADLKEWEFEKIKTLESENGKKFKVKRTVKIKPSKKDGYNWECLVNRHELHFKTKKSARQNLKRIV